MLDLGSTNDLLFHRAMPSSLDLTLSLSSFTLFCLSLHHSRSLCLAPFSVTLNREYKHKLAQPLYGLKRR